MSDRYYASIRIGGDLPHCHVARLGEALELEDAGAAELLQRVESGVLYHDDYEACYGELETLEQTCRELCLSYVRNSGGYFETLPRVAFWQPGLEGPEEHISYDGGDLLVDMDVLIHVRDHLRQGRIAEALALLDEKIVEVPALSPFRVVE
jgi:hypothetical protein